MNSVGHAIDSGVTRTVINVAETPTYYVLNTLIHLSMLTVVGIPPAIWWCNPRKEFQGLGKRLS
jgi:hypothetical protein